jgi:3-hydroxyisobutyrate dehydrogenase
VSGGVEGARSGTLAMMVGGDVEVLEQVRPVLEVVAGRITHMGPVGSGQATKAVNQIMAAGINQAVSEALAFAEAQTLPLDKVIDVVGSGAAGNWFLDHRGRSMVERHFTPGFKVALHHKDLQICQQMAQEFGVALPLVEMTLIHYRRLMEAGFGDEDISALFRHKSGLFE